MREFDYDGLIRKVAAEEEFDEDLIRAVSGFESGGNARAVSRQGARGLMQIVPSTAKAFGVQNIDDPEENLRGGTKYLKHLFTRFNGDISKTLAAYHAGEGAVVRAGGIPNTRDVNISTREYVDRVSGRYNKLKQRDIQAPKPFSSLVEAIKSGNDQEWFDGFDSSKAKPLEKAKEKMSLEPVVNRQAPKPFSSLVEAIKSGNDQEWFDGFDSSKAKPLEKAKEVVFDNGIKMKVPAGQKWPIVDPVSRKPVDIDKTENKFDAVAYQLGYNSNDIADYKKTFGIHPGQQVRTKDGKLIGEAVLRRNTWLQARREKENRAVDLGASNSLDAISRSVGKVLADDEYAVGKFGQGVVQGFTGGNLKYAPGIVGELYNQKFESKKSESGNALVDVAKDLLANPESAGQLVGGLAQIIAITKVLPSGGATKQVAQLAKAGKAVPIELGRRAALEIIKQNAATFGISGAIQDPDREKKMSLGENLANRVKQGVSGAVKGAVIGRINGVNPSLSRDITANIAPDATEAYIRGKTEGLSDEQIAEQMLSSTIAGAALPVGMRGLSKFSSKLQPKSETRPEIRPELGTVQESFDFNGKTEQKVNRVSKAQPIQPTNTATTERGTTVETRYKVVEAGDLITSNDDALNPNPAYPAELQPRDRSRIASEDQISNMASKLNPEFLGASVKAGDGAPIVGSDNVVESGNGRTIATRRAYKSSPESAARYRQYLIDNAEQFGLDPKQIEVMQAPVLVRERLTEVDRVKFAQEANESSVAAMSASEQARVDSSKLTPAMMEIFSPDEDGNLLSASNRDFLRSFIGEVVGQAERARYLTEDGQISVEGINRVKNAIFASAYGERAGLEILKGLSESTDSNIRNVSTALLRNAGRFASLKADIKRGVRYPLDITEDLAIAAKKLSELKETGMSVSDYLSQEAMFGRELSPLQEQVLQVFDNYKRSPKALSTILENYHRQAEAAGDPNQQSFFADVTPSKEEIFGSALKSEQPLKPQAHKEVELPKLESPTRENIRQELINKFKAKEEEVEAVLALADARAEAKGMSPEQWYRARIAAVEKGAGRGRRVPGDAKGATQMLEDGRAIIRALKSPDVTTMVHEFGHIFRRDLEGEDLKALENWARSRRKNAVDEKGIWSREAEEDFARAFERYVYEGKAPTKQLKSAFEKLSNWFRSVYEKLKGSEIDVGISPALKRIFDRMLGSKKALLTDVVKQVELDTKLKLEDYSLLSGRKEFSQAKQEISLDKEKAFERAVGREGGALENAIAFELIKQAEESGDSQRVKVLIEALTERNSQPGQVRQIIATIAKLSPNAILSYADVVMKRVSEQSPDYKRAKAAASRIIKAIDEGTPLDKAVSLLFQRSLKDVPDDIVQIVRNYPDKANRNKEIESYFYRRFNLPTIDAATSKKLQDLAQLVQNSSGREKDQGVALIKKTLSEQVPSSLGSKANFILRQFDLFRPSSWITNSFSDLAYGSPYGLDSLSNRVAAGFDNALNKVGVFKQRSITSPVTKKGEFRENLKESLKEIRQGIDTTQSFENLRGVGDVPFKNAVARKMNELGKIGLGLTQMAGYRTAFDESLRNQMRVSEMNGKPLQEPEPKMFEIAEAEALYRSMQDSNNISEALKSVQKGLNRLTGSEEFGIGTVLITYPQIPGSLFAKAVRYSPLGFGGVVKETAKVIKAHLSKGEGLTVAEQREYVRKLARASLGTGAFAMAAILHRAGVFKKAEEDEESKAKKLQAEMGLKGYKINASALYRLVTDAEAQKLQDGDLLVDYEFLQPFAFLVNLGINLDANYERAVEAAKNKDASLASGTAWELMQGSSTTVSDVSIVRSLLEASKGKGTAKDFAASLVNRFSPGLLRDLRTWLDNTDRATDDDSITETVKNRVVEAVPYYSKSLPAEKKSFGEDRERVIGGTNFFNSVLFGNRLSSYKPDKEREYLLDLYKQREGYGRSNHIPSVPKQVKMADGSVKRLTPEEREDFQQSYGTQAKKLISSLLNSREFLSLPAQQQGRQIEKRLHTLQQKTKVENLDDKPVNRASLMQRELEPPDFLSHNSKVKAAELKAIERIDTLALSDKEREEAIRKIKSLFSRARASYRTGEDKDSNLDRLELAQDRFLEIDIDTTIQDIIDSREK